MARATQVSSATMATTSIPMRVQMRAPMQFAAMVSSGLVKTAMTAMISMMINARTHVGTVTHSDPCTPSTVKPQAFTSPQVRATALLATKQATLNTFASGFTTLNAARHLGDAVRLVTTSFGKCTNETDAQPRVMIFRTPPVTVVHVRFGRISKIMMASGISSASVE